MRAKKATNRLRPRLDWAVCLGFGLLVSGGCEVPEAPEWEVGLSLPFASEPITVNDFLPADVSTDTVNGVPVFTVALQPENESYSLGQMCGVVCDVLQGTTAPVPAFNYADSLEIAFASDLVSIEVTSATLALNLTNGLNFDPLRPHPDPDSAGFIALVTRDAATGALLDSTWLSGSQRTMAPNTTIAIEIDLSGEIREGLRTQVIVSSPLDGQLAAIDTAMTAGFDVSVAEIFVSAVTAVLDDQELNEAFRFDLAADLREEIDDRVQSGSIELELTHNVDIAGTLEVSIAGSQLDLFSGSAATEVRLSGYDLSFAPEGRVTIREVTAAELQFLGAQEELFVGYRGTARGNGDYLGMPISRITPDQSIETRFKVTTRLRVGG